MVKRKCPPGYQYNGFVATDLLGHMMCGYTLLVPMNQRVPNRLSTEYNINFVPFIDLDVFSLT